MRTCDIVGVFFTLCVSDTHGLTVESSKENYEMFEQCASSPSP